MTLYVVHYEEMDRQYVTIYATRLEAKAEMRKLRAWSDHSQVHAMACDFGQDTSDGRAIATEWQFDWGAPMIAPAQADAGDTIILVVKAPRLLETGHRLHLRATTEIVAIGDAGAMELTPLDWSQADRSLRGAVVETFMRDLANWQQEALPAAARDLANALPPEYATDTAHAFRAAVGSFSALKALAKQWGAR